MYLGMQVLEVKEKKKTTSTKLAGGRLATLKIKEKKNFKQMSFVNFFFSAIAYPDFSLA